MYYLQLYRDATHHFTDAIEVDPSYFQAYYNRGYCFELMGDINNAAKDYRKALEIQPDYDLAANGLSRVTEEL
jgi:Tfp pilus assembly protein PilF